MAKQARTRVVTAQQAQSYLSKAEEFIDAAVAELTAGRTIAATSLAIHAAINAADAVTGVRTGRRAAAVGHDEVLALLRDAGRDGTEVERNLARLLPMKTRAEYEPDAIAASAARSAVDRARRCVEVARRAVGTQRG